MYLFLNTSAKNVALYSGKGEIEWHSVEPREQRYSEKLKQLLIAHGLRTTDLKGVVVMQGQGAFSDTRAGVAISNLLLELASVPVVSIETVSGTDPWIKALQKLGTAPLQPSYYAEPNITKAKE